MMTQPRRKGAGGWPEVGLEGLPGSSTLPPARTSAVLVTCAEGKARPEGTCEQGRPRLPTHGMGSLPCLCPVPPDGLGTVPGPAQLCRREWGVGRR